MILFYDHTSSQESFNQARKQLFTQNSPAIDGLLLPMEAALLQHKKMCLYQAGHCWGQMMAPALELPSKISGGGGGETQGDGMFTGPHYQK